MILIISDTDDQSTNDVIDWLAIKGKDFFRINRTDAFDLEHIELNDKKSNFILTSSNNKYKLSFKSLTSYWYRRGWLNIKFTNIQQLPEIQDDLSYFYNGLNNYLIREHKIVVDCLYGLLYSLHGFGKFHESDTNKLTNLIIAKSVGLKIPDTVLSNEKEVLADFFKTSKNEAITKSLNPSGGLFWGNIALFGYTKTVSLDEIEKMNCIWVSFLQKKINKKYELRIFYLDGKIFSSAIFSQSNHKTKVDFRNYDREKPNRVIPYTFTFKYKKLYN